MTNFVQLCRERGFLHQCTDEEGLSELLGGDQAVPAYIGFDCTAPSLHVGSLVQIMMLRWLQKAGHKPIVLMGGGTTKVGDPSGKDEARKMLSDEQIAANMAGIKKVFEKFLVFEDSHPEFISGSHRDEMLKQVQHDGNYAIMVNNDDWLKDLPMVQLLQFLGPHFSINRMLSMDSVKNRLDRDQEMSFLEFNYMIMQAFDFHVLNSEHQCRLQMGGSDQWGNIVMGVDLNRRLHAAGSIYGRDAHNRLQLKAVNQSDKYKNLFGLTSPLITTASGAKMGKTASGAVWLNFDAAQPDYSKSPYEYWQFWRNTEDADVIRFLKLFTELPLGQITEYESWLGTAKINEAKIILANEATALLHGEAAAREAAETAKKVFEQGGVGEALPEITLPAADLAAGIAAFKILQEAGLASSGKEARQKITEKAARVNDAVIEDANQLIGSGDMKDGAIKLSVGKKRHALVKSA